MSCRSLKAYLYPNPSLEGPKLVSKWGDEYEIKNTPCLEIKFRNFSPGTCTVKVIEPVKLEKEVNIQSDIESIFFKDQAFSNPEIEEVKIEINDGENEEEYSLSTPTHKIHGEVRDFDGKGFPAYLWDSDKPGNAVKTNDDGSFEFYYPEGKELMLFVDDESYAEDTLESWINSEGLVEDVEINPHVGEYELRSFRAWKTIGKVFVFFVPASVNMETKNGSYTKGSMKYVDLNRKDIEGLWINEEKQAIENISKHMISGSKREYPSYILSVDIDEENLERPLIVKTVVSSEEKGRGEAHFIL